MPRRLPDTVVIRCSFEKPSCIAADGDGGWNIKLTVPDSDSAAMLELSKMRGDELICTFIRRRHVRGS